MTVSVQDPISWHTANGATTVFAYQFKILSSEHLSVYVDDVLTTSGFTIDGVGAANGGNVTFTTAPANASEILLIREVPAERTDYDYQSSGDFISGTVNNDIDQHWMFSQQLLSYLENRALMFPKTLDRSGKTNALPAPSDGSVLYWSNGEIAQAPINDLSSTVTLASSVKGFPTLAAAVADVNLVDGDTINIKERTTGNGGGATWDVVLASGVTPNTYNIVQCTGVATLALVLRVGESLSLKQFGANGDGATDDTLSIEAWLDEIISRDAVGYIPDGEFLCNYITKAVNNGIKIKGSGTIKATGSNRVNMIRFTGARGRIEIDGPTFDANDIVARALEIQNTSSTSSTLGSVYISPKTRFINAKNNAPDTNTAIGLYVVGGFTDVTFEGEIDTVDSSSTTGAVSVGLLVTWSASASDDWVRSTTLTSAARIRNVKNDNIALADADGVQCLAPTSQTAIFSVAAGALFENCKGRSIKSQVVANSIIAPVIIRDAYDGLSEINLQYAGGKVFGSEVHHAGTRTDSIISISQRPTPDNAQCSIIANELYVTGSPSSNTGAMVATDVTDAAVKLQGVTVRDNKVHGEVDTMVSCRVANVVDVNRILIDGNWAESIGVAYLTTTLYGAARAQLSVIFTNNSSEAACTGGSITNDLIVEYARNNHNIGQLISTPYTSVIATGAAIVYGCTQRIDTEGGAASDDLDTINTTDAWDNDQWLTLHANNDARTVVLKDGTGNLKLAGDFSLDNTEDRITLQFDGTNWVELFRSDNGA